MELVYGQFVVCGACFFLQYCKMRERAAGVHGKGGKEWVLGGAEHFLGITPAQPGGCGGEALLGVKAILLVTRNWYYFPCSICFSPLFCSYMKKTASP